MSHEPGNVMDIEAVHQARVATRRLKAATNLLGPILSIRSRRRFDKVTRSLRRQLGPLRDIDVMVGHVGEIRSQQFAGALSWLKFRLGERRAQGVKETHDSTDAPRMLAKLGSWWGLRHEIADARSAVDGLLATSVRVQLNAFAQQATDLSKGDPHALRISGKSLRYTLEMARAHGLPVTGAMLAQFKRMQDALGTWHDFVVLSQWMVGESVKCELSLHQSELQKQVLRLSLSTLRRADGRLKKMAELWSTRGEKLAGEIRDAFGLHEPIVEAPLLIDPAAPAA